MERWIKKSSEDIDRWVDKKLQENGSIDSAELGVGIGSTTLSVAEKINGSGEIHLFDFERRVDELADDLGQRILTLSLGRGKSTNKALGIQK